MLIYHVSLVYCVFELNINNKNLCVDLKIKTSKVATFFNYSHWKSLNYSDLCNFFGFLGPKNQCLHGIRVKLLKSLKPPLTEDIVWTPFINIFGKVIKKTFYLKKSSNHLQNATSKVRIINIFPLKCVKVRFLRHLYFSSGVRL